MLHPARRIVTGHDADGRAVVLSDEVSPHVLENPARPGRGLTDLWRSGQSPASNEGGADEKAVIGNAEIVGVVVAVAEAVGGSPVAQVDPADVGEVGEAGADKLADHHAGIRIALEITPANVG